MKLKVKIKKKLVRQAEFVLEEIDMTMDDAITIFLTQLVLRGTLPIDRPILDEKVEGSR